MEIARHWRLKNQRYQLIGQICQNCDTKIFPPQPICPKCRGEENVVEELNKNGPIKFEITTRINLKYVDWHD